MRGKLAIPPKRWILVYSNFFSIPALTQIFAIAQLRRLLEIKLDRVGCFRLGFIGEDPGRESFGTHVQIVGPFCLFRLGRTVLRDACDDSGHIHTCLHATQRGRSDPDCFFDRSLVHKTRHFGHLRLQRQVLQKSWGLTLGLFSDFSPWKLRLEGILLH